MTTKNDIVLGALAEIRISGITVSASPSEISDAVLRLDNMMLDWDNDGLMVTYNQPEEYGQSDPNDESGLPREAVFAVIANLAKVLCARYGKQCHHQTLSDAKNGKDALYCTVLPQKEYDPYLPIGSGRVAGGNEYYRSKFQPSETEEESCVEVVEEVVEPVVVEDLNYNPKA